MSMAKVNLLDYTDPETVERAVSAWKESDGAYTLNEWVMGWFGVDTWRARDIIRSRQPAEVVSSSLRTEHDDDPSG